MTSIQNNIVPCDSSVEKPHSGTSIEHHQVQRVLHNILPQNTLEHAFPTIKRIADLYCPALRLVFEIQCSLLSVEEAEQRIADYSSLGIYVVWILHEKCFGQNKLTALEKFLLNKNLYYTDITPSGIGSFFDIWVYRKRHSYYKTNAKFLVHFPKGFLFPHITAQHIGSGKFYQRSIYFHGDCVDLFIKNKLPFPIDELTEKLIQKQKPPPSFIQRYQLWLKQWLLHS